MTLSWTRRDMLRALATAAGSGPLLSAAAGPARRRVGIVGAGMAGISLAWLLDGQCDVVLLEARDTFGGNVRSLPVDLDGHQFIVDLGAQYFHPGPYPLYTALLRSLHIFPPEAAVPEQSHAFAASITVANPTEPTPRFVSPVLPERWWPLLAPWNWSGIGAFAVAFNAAAAREQRQESWTLTLDEWLPTLGLAREQWEGMLLPWAASLGSGDIDHTRGLSARSVFIFAAKALPANPLSPVFYYVLNQGMAEVMRRMLDQCSTVQLATNAGVGHVSREGHDGFKLKCGDGRSFTVDDVVFASSGPPTLDLLARLPGTQQQQARLREIDFYYARLALHTDPIYAPTNPFFQSFLNCEIEGGFCEASMHLADVATGAPRTTTEKLWKSWVTHRQIQPSQILHEAEFKHVAPTPASFGAQAAISQLQGRDRIWFVGGYLQPFDSQETALQSALSVTGGMQVQSPRAQALLASVG